MDKVLKGLKVLRELKVRPKVLKELQEDKVPKDHRGLRLRL